MNLQFYEIDINLNATLNLTNIYKNITFVNDSALDVDVYYRSILVCRVPANFSLTFFDVFKSGKGSDDNIQLNLVTSGLVTKFKIYNFGRWQNDFK